MFKPFAAFVVVASILDLLFEMGDLGSQRTTFFVK
jgi:hypothetical protein